MKHKSKATRGLNSIKPADRAARIRKPTRLSRLDSTFETLESRTMLSMGVVVSPTAPPVSSVKPASVKVESTPKPGAPTSSQKPIAKATAAPVKAAPLLPPVALIATGLNGSQIKLAWTDSEKTATGYAVLRSLDGVHFAQVGKPTSATAVTFIDSGLTSGQAYKYEVEALKGSTASKPSTLATGITTLGGPAGLSAAVTSSSPMHLTWTDNDRSATGYIVLRSINAAPFTSLVKLNTADATTFDDKTVGSFNQVAYEVEATDATTTSSPSNIAAATSALAAPKGVAAAATGPTSVKITWTDTDPATLGYLILRSNGTSSIFSQAGSVAAGNVTTWTDSTVSSNTGYSYQVKAVNGTTVSIGSGTSAVTTPLKAPIALVCTLAGGGIAVTWTGADAAATGYVIARSNDSVHFSTLATLTSGSVSTYIDTTALSGQSYSYEVMATTSAGSSTYSAVANVVTPLIAPIAVTSTGSTGSVVLNWTNRDSSATGYNISRSSDGITFMVIAKVTAGDAATFTDTTITSAKTYYYKVQAFNAVATSPTTTSVKVTTPLQAPIGLNATCSGSYVALSWTIGDPNSLGYNVLRSTDGVTYSIITTLSGPAISNYTDTTASSAHIYYYQVQGFSTSVVSAFSNAVQVTTPVLAPTGLIANANGSSIVLTWTDRDTSATGYNVLRSTDGVSFTILTTLWQSAANSYTDITPTVGQKYEYQVQAVAGTMTSVVSNTCSAATAPFVTPLIGVVTTPVSLPSSSSVTITTRYGSEMVITATGRNDTLSISQNGSMLAIVANGQTAFQPVPAAGLFIYTRGGTDGISIDSSVTVQTTVETIDAAVDTITNHSTSTSIWDDSNDIITGTGTVHSVRTFAGGVSMAAGVSLPDPTDSGVIGHANASLWGTGPVAGDVNQGNSGDCYFLSSLAAFAGVAPSRLQQSAVDMGDGTYTVSYISNGSPQYVRVSNDLPVRGNGVDVYARAGNTGSIWAQIMEKAYAFFRTGANTYASISSGWMGDVYTALGVQSTFFYTSSLMSDSAMYARFSADLAAHKAVTFGTYGVAPTLVSGHAYTLISVSMTNGVGLYTVRNPWGVAGDPLENSQGYATLTYSQIEANCLDGCDAFS